MSQIIVLLQLALALLANPQTSNSTSTQALVSQAVSLATEALASAAPVVVANPVIEPTSTPVVIQAPIVSIGSALATVVESSTPVTPSLSVPVSFSSNGNLGYVTIKNTLNETIRVKDMEVDGMFDHLSFSDSPNWTFQARFDCNGLGSLGYQSVYGDPHMDVCARRDNGQAVNEIAPGESMTLEYSGNPTGITTGTIETDSGEPVTF